MKHRTKKRKGAAAPHGRAGNDSAPHPPETNVAGPAADAATPRDQPGNLAQHGSARELAVAVTTEIDLVSLAKELLGKDQGKNASVKVRMWENLVEQLWGKPGAPGADETPVNIVWDIPAPARESTQK